MRQFLYLLNKFCPLQRDHLIIEVIKYCARVCFLYILLGKWKMAAAFNLNIYKHKRKVFRSSSSCFLKDIQNAYLDVLDVVLFSVKILRSGLQGRPIHDWQRLCVCSSSFLLLDQQCVWDHFHANKWSCRQPDTVQMVLHSGWKSDSTFLRA